jgi:hypothetical protein
VIDLPESGGFMSIVRRTGEKEKLSVAARERSGAGTFLLQSTCR